MPTMTETQRDLLLRELAEKTRLLVTLKLDRRLGKYVPNARVARLTRRVNILRDTLYPAIHGGRS